MQLGLGASSVIRSDSAKIGSLGRPRHNVEEQLRSLATTKKLEE